MFDLKHIGVAKSTFGSHSSASGDLQTLIQMQGVIYKLGTLKLKLTIMNLSSKINPVSAKHLQPTKTLVGTFWHFVSLKIGFGAHMLILEVWLWNYGFQIPIHTSRFNLPLDLFLSYCPQWQELIWEICQGQTDFYPSFLLLCLAMELPRRGSCSLIHPSAPSDASHCSHRSVSSNESFVLMISFICAHYTFARLLLKGTW